MSAQVLTESKRRLRVLEFELGEKMIDEVERAHATKYHKVKHFGKPYTTCIREAISTNFII